MTDHSTAAGTSDLGAHIRRARLARNLTLKDIERKANVSATHVSEIERGLTSPTVGALLRIADALETPAYRLLGEDTGSRVSVVRAGERTVLTEAGSGARYHRLSGGFAGSELSLLEIELESGAGHAGGPPLHPGEELLHVLRGVVELNTGEDGRERDVLKEGDSIHLRPRPGRTLRNIGDGEARVLWAISPPFAL
jgi:transcriptional regulator with XRE-family HTH domain